jgi:hypothetical protein
MSGSGKPDNICYYSNNCKWSKAFLTELSKTPYKKDFMFLCVDPAQNRPPLPSWLKKVPTLVIRGEQEPLTDGEVMNWLSIRRLQDSGAKPVTSGAPASGSEPEAYMWNEMGGSLTKSFSFVDNSGDAPQGNFEFLNGAAAPGVRTGSDMPDLGARGASQKSRKEQMFDKQMESYMRSRDDGMPPHQMRQ